MSTSRLGGGALAGVVALMLAATGCASSASRAEGSSDVLRLGVFATFTHAPAQVGLGTGIFQRVLAPTRIEMHRFNSGTDAGIALLSGSIDASYMGPWPTASLFLQSGKVAVVSGATVGGASFVVRHGAGISTPGDLHDTRIAVPNVGNSQDIALRTWLHSQGLRTTDEGGDVSVTERAGPELLQLFRAGRLDGAWFPEPYPTYLVDQGAADPFVDEASLWPDGAFLTANLVVSTIYMGAHPDVVRRLVDANVQAILFLQGQQVRAKAIVERQLVAAGGPVLSLSELDEAWAKLAFTWDPLPSSMERVAEDAYVLGVLPERPTRILDIYRLDDLNAVLDDEGLPPVEVP